MKVIFTSFVSQAFTRRFECCVPRCTLLCEDGGLPCPVPQYAFGEGGSAQASAL